MQNIRGAMSQTMGFWPFKTDAVMEKQNCRSYCVSEMRRKTCFPFLFLSTFRNFAPCSNRTEHEKTIIPIIISRADSRSVIGAIPIVAQRHV